MVIDNTRIVVDTTCKYYNDILTYFVKIEDDIIKKLYEVDDQGNIIIDRGLRFLLPKDLIDQCDDISDHDIDVLVESDPEFYRNILDGITLRDDQILAVMKSLYHKRGLCQLPTGSGKTICIAAILKYYYIKLGYYPDTVIFEPTNYLVNDMISRFSEYGIPVTVYKDNRTKISGVVVTHPISMYNDIKIDNSIFDNVKIFIGDEFHHQSCETWYTIYNNMRGLEVSLGFSASMIGKEKLPIVDLSKLTYDELVIIGCTGALLINFDPSYYIEKGILAKPVLFRMNNPASEFVYNDKNWHNLRKSRLESDNRTKLICGVTTTFNIINYKVLILVSTKSYAETIMKELVKYGVSDKCICSFGGGKYLRLNKDNEIEDCSNDNPKEKFSTGEYNIMIGTSHLYEGADIPNLDAVILASVGKQVRRLIQGVGRSLRKSKTGKYAYIIDFTDHLCSVLKYHSDLRLSLYVNTIGVDQSNVFDYCTITSFKETLRRLENF